MEAALALSDNALASYWRDAARGVKRALLADKSRSLAGSRFRLAYEARHERGEADLAFLRRLTQGASCVLDVGANVGTASLVMLQDMADDGVVYAVEPSEAACQVAQRNARLNGVADRVHVVNVLAGARTGEVTAFHWDGVSPQGSVVGRPRGGGGSVMMKACVTLDCLVTGLSLRPEVVKVDVEGAEGDVLRGAAGVLAEHRCMVALELHAWKGVSVGENATGILETLRSVDYEMIRLRTRRIVKGADDFAELPGTDGSVQFRARALCVPCERGVPSWLAEFDTSEL
jgi:FkbM family methyltransferase